MLLGEANQLRSRQPKAQTALAKHLPRLHRRYAGWTNEKLCRRAQRIGRDTGTLVALQPV
ncbi:MAG: hypothetical protein EA356_18170 [Geminicoccaceae bacterium]|nr:MAG: hypothetical protein EA356_18170 [Geminicoccaceae bacterium]